MSTNNDQPERLLTYEHCGATWSQTWTSEVEDDCPACGVSVTPQYEEGTA